MTRIKGGATKLDPKQTCRNCRYLAGERIDLCVMHYCSINNDEENAKQSIDEPNTCQDYEK